MKKIKVVLSICLIITILASVGCGKTADKDNEAVSSNGGEATNKHYNIKIGLWDSANYGDDDIAEYLNEKFNVTLSFENFSWADYLQSLNVAASSESLPDMFAHPAWSNVDTRTTFFQWIQHEVIKPLPEDLSEYKNISALMKDFEFLRTREGSHYMLPRTAWKPENAFVSQAMWVRKDWMENVGITKMPTDSEELYELLKAFTYDDPDGNGKDDTYGITKGGEDLWVLNMFQIEDANWIEEDGRYIPGKISKRNIDAIKYLKRLYDEGIIDPDYTTIRPEQGMDKFISGKVGAIAYTSEAYHFKENLVDKMMKINSEWGPDVVDIIAPVATEYGDPVVNSFDNYWSGTLFKGSMDDDKMKRCLEIYDFLLSEEGLELGRFGLEDKHFEMDGDNYKSLLPIDPDTNLPKTLTLEQPTAGIKALVTWDVDGRWLEPSMPERCIELEKKAHDLLVPYERDIDPRVRYISTPAVDSMQIGDIYREMLFKGFMGTTDIEKHFNDYLKNVYDNYNMQEVIDEFNEEVRKQGIK
ncbi:extracellular solute-binding protein [Vallitalea sp.]|jgi:ABC-type glycerol-3-phosphate transport system substrate-binding protein|uniref:extracellular solute-binding protein n=1 Tax=Vallitalea sp. TaxID=1882829 RepID=UPI0025F3C751|nr:extracellular solute-binding protein [Vallitalea sp.]MCT4687123.1 extracellular solute-binding protein [Vallitalea sp.]